MSQVPVDTFIDEEIDRQERCRMLWVNHYRGWVIFFTLLIFLPFLFLQPEAEFRCLYMFMVMVVFWITEVIPPGITALLPIIGLPAFGYKGSGDACMFLFQSPVVLFIASLLISMAIESSNLHTRMGLCLVKVIGPKPRILMLFFMCFTAFFSMLLPNTLITALMCPILKAVLEELGTQGVIELVQPDRAKPEEEPYPSKMVIVFYLSIAYSASIGGLAFLTSTGTHPVFKKLFEQSFKDDHSFDFKRWAGMGLPLAVVCLLLIYIWLQFFYFGMGRPNSKRAQLYKKTPEELAKAAEGIKERRLALGKMSRLECQIVMVLLLVFVLVVTMKPMFVPGYDDWLNTKEFKASAPVMICACALFILPMNYGFLRYCCCKKPDPVGERENLLTWRFVHKNMLWNMMLVFAGSFGLATALDLSGLAKAVVIHTLSVAKGWPGMLLQLCCILMGIFSTAFIINVGMAAVLTPIMIEFAKTTDWHVGYLTVPMILALSMAFLFPFSTPANAIVAGRGHIRTKDMFVAGIGPTLIGILMILFCCNTWMFLMWSYFKGKIPAADDG